MLGADKNIVELPNKRNSLKSASKAPKFDISDYLSLDGNHGMLEPSTAGGMTNFNFVERVLQR